MYNIANKQHKPIYYLQWNILKRLKIQKHASIFDDVDV